MTPEYNHGYPGYLKTAVDSVVQEWEAKPVGFVSYGGLSGGSRSVQQLRTVFAELQAVTVREQVVFSGVWDRFDEAGRLVDPERYERAAATMLDQLGGGAAPCAPPAARSRPPDGYAVRSVCAPSSWSTLHSAGVLSVRTARMRGWYRTGWSGSTTYRNATSTT